MSHPFLDKELLLKFTGFSYDLLGTLSGPLLPGCEFDVVPFKISFQADSVTRYVVGTEPRTTATDDVPVNQVIRGGMLPYVSFKNMLFDGVEAKGHGSSDVGVISIEDFRGQLDSSANLAWDGGDVEVYRGDRGTPIGTWTRMAKLTAAGIAADSRTKQIALRPLDDKMLKAQLHDVRYAGTGGIEGDETLKGQPKPWLVGRRFNVTPVTLVSALLILQFSFAPSQAVYGVRDGGTVLLATTDYPDYASLAAATIAGGYYATCLALGLVRLGGAPTKGVTVDAAGDTSLAGGVGYSALRSEICRRIVLAYGGYRLQESDLDQDGFDALAAAQPGVVGFYFTGEWTKGDALDHVLLGCMGYWWFTPLGVFRIGNLTAIPTAADIVAYIPGDGQDAGDYRIVGEPSIGAYGTPRRTTQLGWSPNSTVQEPGALNPGVDPADVAIYGLPARLVTDVSTRFGRAWPTAPIFKLEDSGFFDRDEAQAEATRAQALMGDQRRRFLVEVEADQFIDPIGRAVEVRGWRRYGFRGSRVLFCAGIDVKNKNRVILHLWG